MHKVEIFDKKRKWWSARPDLELLNERIGEIEKDGWKICSVVANTSFGEITSYTILIELVE